MQSKPTHTKITIIESSSNTEKANTGLNNYPQKNIYTQVFPIKK